MSYRHQLALLGFALIALGVLKGGWLLLLVWLGGNFLGLGIAHGRGGHRIFGKRPDGTLPVWSWLVFFPLLAYTAGVWHLLRLLTREPACQVITEQLVVGRRLLPSEIEGEFDNYIDLTAELPEPAAIRRCSSYRCVPILDGAAPSPEALREAVRGLRPGRTFIHCAQGHGRTGLFALAVLLECGGAPNVEEGLQRLRAVRPGIRLSEQQIRVRSEVCRGPDASALISPMRFHHYHPQPPLSWFVNLLWLYEGGNTPHARERLLPTGTVEVVFSFEDEPMRVFDREDRLHTFRGSVICGPHSEYFAIDSTQQGLVLGIHFHPGGTFPFFDLPAAELQNLHVGLDTLWGGAAHEIRERVMEVAEPEAKLRLVEKLLLARAIRPLACHPAVAFALQELSTVPNARTIAEVTDQIGLSQKHFIRVFSEAVGLTPKLFCRVRRFQEAIARIHAGRRVDWTAVALDCGYFDQAHFNRDFRAFSGLNPSTYLAVRTEHMNHVPLGD